MKITETCILEDRGIIYIEGPDTKEFLQNIITNNLNKISDKQSIYSSLLTAQGKYLFDFILVKHKKGYLIDCEKMELENLIIFDSSGNEMEFIYDKDVLKNGLEFSENTNSLWLFKNSSDHWKVGYNSESDMGKFNFDVKDFGWIFVHGKDVIFLAIIVSSLILLYFIQKAGYGEKSLV